MARRIKVLAMIAEAILSPQVPLHQYAVPTARCRDGKTSESSQEYKLHAKHWPERGHSAATLIAVSHRLARDRNRDRAKCISRLAA
jgi:hypothetical protein